MVVVSEPEQDEKRVCVGGQPVVGNEWPQARRTGIVSGRMSIEIEDWLLYYLSISV